MAKKAEIEVAARGAGEMLFAAASWLRRDQSDGTFVISRISHTHITQKPRVERAPSATQPLKAAAEQRHALKTALRGKKLTRASAFFQPGIYEFDLKSRESESGKHFCPIEMDRMLIQRDATSRFTSYALR